jgi:SSS family solute:Na+ symporter
MSGSGYAIGLAIASYEWMAALTLIIVGKWFLPIFLANRIYTMPQFLEQRYGTRIRTLMAVFWLALYIFVNLTSIIWLGSIAVTKVAGVDQTTALVALGLFALLYQLWGGLRAVAMTDIVQVTLLVLGGLLVSGLTLNEIGNGAGVVAGFSTLLERAPDHFHMILTEASPYYKDLPGLSVLIGGMWIANLSYWGFNQYIIQRALAAKSLSEAQKGVIFAAYLKLLMPVIIVLPGIAAVILAPDLTRPDEAYPTMMRILPAGIAGLVFAALIAAIVASTASKINSVATIFTLDIYSKIGAPKSEARLVNVGRIAAVVAILLAILAARPLLGSFDQAFQYIQEYTGFFTPGIVVIFLLGLFWKRATEAGALAATIGSFALSVALKALWPELPFMDRMGVVFVLALVLAVVCSLIWPAAAVVNRIQTVGVGFRTSAGFNIGAVGVIVILIALYTAWW